MNPNLMRLTLRKKKRGPNSSLGKPFKKTGSPGETFPKKRLKVALFVQSGAVLALKKN